MSNAQGKWLKEGRTKAKLTQAQVAEMIGVKSWDISDFETGRVQPNGHLEALCEIYGRNAKDAPRWTSKRGTKKTTQDQSTPCETYVKIAQLAASVKDTDIAMAALAKIESL